MGFRRNSEQQQPELRPALADDEALSPTLGWKPSGHELMIMIVLSVISCMVSLDATIIVTSLSSIVEDLQGSTTLGIWVGTAYLLSTAVAMPFLSSLSDIFGRPIVLIFSVSMFTVGTIICATSHGFAQLLAGRSIQGTGGGGIVVVSLVIFTDIVPLRHRPKWYGTVQGAWALGTCIGPIAGGAIAEHTTWRWIFYIMLPFCAFGLVTIPFLLTMKPRVETMGVKLRRIDWAGSLIFMASATSFLIAISWGGTQFSWSSAATLAPLAAGAAGLAGTAVWERFGAREPFMRHELFRCASAVATYVCSAAQGLLLFGQLYYIPFYLMSVLAYTPLHTGLCMLPVMLTLVPSSVVTGALITRFNNYRWPIWAGWAVCTVGCGLATIWGVDTHAAVWAITLIILGFGHGATLNAQNFAAQAICGPGDEAHAAATYAFMRHLGTALGVGIGGTAFQNVMASQLRHVGAPVEIARQAESFLPQLLAMPAGQAKDDIVSGYVSGIRGVFRVYLAISGVAFFVSLLIRFFDMNKDLRTEHKLQENRISRIERAAVDVLLAVKEVPERDIASPHSRTSSRTHVDLATPPPAFLKTDSMTPRESLSTERPATVGDGC
ncbi:MFS general substrate transporter [Cryphonectria parasitica EP155]|uniref:MFS general substrate transporter n=1 Tax=Cryphonectria parasitica (strain ATCC 38755 / EP155) TaxID=660469 RepID=A0A9P5CLC6_CRYP1|nr:MFS general substrate transporter [Cryphonectria parasitica EP155]KAF3761690.1 MFS general substrate transporter [Cryphonectria parasitica EP155]